MVGQYYREICFLGGHFWKYKPPEGAVGDKSRVLGHPNLGKKSSSETVLLMSFNEFLKLGSKLLSVALTC